MRVVPQPRPVSGLEKANPGSDGITRSNAIDGSRSCARGSVSGPITSRYSTTEPGQPCVRISGKASGSGDLTCRKWMSWPSISVMNCGQAFSLASAARQSKPSRQYPASRRTQVRLMP